jgi:hypothetical protein
VAVDLHSGLSDRLVGIVTVFLHALVTNRAFMVVTPPGLLPLESVYNTRPSAIPWASSNASVQIPVPQRILEQFSRAPPSSRIVDFGNVTMHDASLRLQGLFLGDLNPNSPSALDMFKGDWGHVGGGSEVGALHFS